MKPVIIIAIAFVFLLTSLSFTSNDVRVYALEPNTIINLTWKGRVNLDTTINQGDRICWEFVRAHHSVTSETFDSGIKSMGFEYCNTFNEVGEFSYICIRHNFMQGIVRVQEIDNDTIPPEILIPADMLLSINNSEPTYKKWFYDNYPQYNSTEQAVRLELTQKIPDWVKTIFEWYSQDQVSEDELLNATKYLINEGILVVD